MVKLRHTLPLATIDSNVVCCNIYYGKICCSTAAATRSVNVTFVFVTFIVLPMATKSPGDAVPVPSAAISKFTTGSVPGPLTNIPSPPTTLSTLPPALASKSARVVLTTPSETEYIAISEIRDVWCNSQRW